MFFEVASQLRPGYHVLCLGNFRLERMAALALFVGKRGSVTVYSDFSLSPDRKLFEESMKKEESKLESLKNEANLVFINDQDSLPDLEEEWDFCLSSALFSIWGDQLLKLRREKREQDEPFTIKDTICFVKKCQKSETLSSSRKKKC